MTILFTSDIRRYEFTTDTANFIRALKEQFQDQYTVDPYWEVVYDPNNEHSQSRSYNNTSHIHGSPCGAILIRNRKRPHVAFTLALVYSMRSHSYSGTYYNYLSYQLKVGLKNPGDRELEPDVCLNKGAGTNIPFHITEDPTTTGSSNYDRRRNVNWKFNLFTSEHFVLLIGEYLDYSGWAYPFRLYMGEIMPYDVEDPKIADNFYGYFSHSPVLIDNENWAFNTDYNVGRGIVRASRNNTEYEIYNFATSSTVTSPGLGGKYFVSPFYVYHPDEGVRGEFWGMRTAVLKNSVAYPDGSILDIGGKRYYVFHVVDQVPPRNTKSWYDSNGSVRHQSPYFFDSNLLYGGGQRVILFEIDREDFR